MPMGIYKSCEFATIKALLDQFAQVTRIVFESSIHHQEIAIAGFPGQYIAAATRNEHRAGTEVLHGQRGSLRTSRVRPPGTY